MINYLSFIEFVNRSHPTVSSTFDTRFLVSGNDVTVKNVIGNHIISSCYNNGKTLYVLDNTKKPATVTLHYGLYHTVDIVNSDFGLCHDLLEVDSLPSISRLKTILTEIGFNELKALQVINYLHFVKNIEVRLGNKSVLGINTLTQYSGTLFVKQKLDKLLNDGLFSREEYEYLFGKYAEVSAAAADFDNMLCILSPFLGNNVNEQAAIVIPFGEYRDDKSLVAIMSRLIISKIKEDAEKSALLIIDCGVGDRSFLIDIVRNITDVTEVHIISDDAFSLNDSDIGVLMNSLSVHVFSAHSNMISCQKIEKQLGEIDVIKRSSSVTVDRRIRESSVWDILLDTNRTETSTNNAPTKEYRHKKEKIRSLSSGSAIVEFKGEQSLLTFSSS